VTSADLRADELLLELAPEQKQRTERTLRIPLQRVRSGYSHVRPDGRVRVNLELSGGLSDGDRIELDLDPEVAEPLVRRLVGQAPEFELTRSGVRFDAALGALSIAGGVALAFGLAERVHERVLGASAHTTLAMGWSIGLCVVGIGLTNAILTLLFSPRRILVGVDGLRIESVFRRRFMSYESIAGVRATKRALVIEDRAGRTTWLLAPGVEASRLHAIAGLANERLANGAPAGPVLPRWQPGTLRRWREAILKSVDATSYRDGSLSNDDLASFLSAPGVPRERRVAAAIALASRGEREVKENIRIAAGCLADDATRRILERVAEEDDDDDALETLLAEQRAPAYHKQL